MYSRLKNTSFVRYLWMNASEEQSKDIISCKPNVDKIEKS